MFNKRELVLIISLAFCFGVIFSDFTKPKSIQAGTSNIVAETLDRKIAAVSRDLNELSGRVSALEAAKSKKDSRVNNLSVTVKKLSSVQKDLTNSLDKVVRDLVALKKIQTQQQEILRRK